MTGFFARRLEHHARAQPDQPALATSARTWTWRELEEASRGVAEALAAAGARADTIAVIAMSRGPEVAFAVAGARRLGAVPAIVDPGDAEQVATLCARLRPSAVVVRARDAVAEAIGTLALDAAAPVDVSRPLGWQPREAVSGISHLIHTSGTTGDGKCIAWGEARARADATNRPPVGGPGRPAIIVPLCTSLGFHELLRALAQGCCLGLVEEPFPLALRVLRDLDATGFQCTPTHVELLLRSGAPLPPTLRQINVSSAPIGRDRLQALAARIAPAVVTKSYGLTEVGPVTVLRADELDHADTVGRPAPGREVTIVDATGAPLPQGQTGEIVVRIHAAPEDGYFPPAEDGRFVAGVLRTGDRGHFESDGFLVLEARTAELIKVGGRTVSAPRIEQQLGALGVFGDVAVVSVPHHRLGEVPAVAFTPSRNTPSLAVLGRLVACRLRREELPRWYLARRALPRTPSGKLRRGAIASDLRRWVEAWPSSVTCGTRILPARALDKLDHSSGVLQVFAADGAPARWPRWAGARPRDPFVRVISVVSDLRSGLVALACIHGDHTTEMWISPAFQRSGVGDRLRPVLDDAARRLQTDHDFSLHPCSPRISPPEPGTC